MSDKGKPRIWRDLGREEDFRKQLDKFGVVQELQRLKLWRDSGARSKQPRGFSFEDLWKFFWPWVDFGRSSRRDGELRKDAHRLAEKAQQLRDAVQALRWARKYDLNRAHG